MKVKMINGNMEWVEEKVNQWLDNNKDKKVIDIKLTEDDISYTATIMYEEEQSYSPCSVY